MTPLVSGSGGGDVDDDDDDGHVLSVDLGWLIRVLQLLCWMMGLSWWKGALVLLPLVPGDDLLVGVDDEGGDSSDFIVFLTTISSFSGFSGWIGPPVFGLEFFTRLHALGELADKAGALVLTRGRRAGGGGVACGGRVGGGKQLLELGCPPVPPVYQNILKLRPL